jgi:hypothetical protein
MDEGNAEVKGYTLRLMKLLGKEISNQIKGSLMHDKGMLRWYENGELSQRALGELAASCFGDSPNNNKK